MKRRWQLRAEMDAVVAHAYGLDRAQYDRLLAGFSHKSFPGAPARCAAAFDAVAAIGLPRFCNEIDPYRDIALVTTPAERALYLSASPGRQRSLLPATGRASA